MRWISILVLFLSSLAWTQTVTITGTVQDSNGNAYASGSGQVQLVSGNGMGQQSWTYKVTNPVQTPIVITALTSSGSFSITLFNTSLIDQSFSAPQWKFSFCSNPAATYGQGSTCFTMNPMALTSNQDISATIKSQATTLPTVATGGGSGTVTSVATTSPITGGTFTTSGTIGCATCVTSAAALTSNSPVLGGGLQASSTATFLTTDGATQLNIGPADATNNGILGLNGKTSGTATFTAPAVAGTTSNPVVSSNVINAPGFNGAIGGTTPAAGTFTTVSTGGTVAGQIALGQGTAASAPTTAVGLTAPTSVTSYQIVFPGAAASGIPHYANSSNVVTESISAVSLSADVTGQLPISAVGSSGLSGTAVTIASTGALDLAAQYKKGFCTEVWGGTGTSNVLQATDDAISNNTCYNDSGVNRTITAVKCRSDYSSNTTTVNPSFGSAGTGTTILGGALTCGSSYAYSSMSTGCGGSTCTISNATWTTGTGIDPVMGTPDTHSTSLAMIVEYTY